MIVPRNHGDASALRDTRGVRSRLPIGGGDTCRTFRVALDDGSTAFEKSLAAAPAGFFPAEANGLRWLGEAGGPPLPEVLAVGDDYLRLSWIDGAQPSAGGAERLGRDLAVMHRAGAPAFGAPWRGFIGSLPLDNTPHTTTAPDAGWAAFYATRRLRPFARRAAETGGLDADGARAVEALCERLTGAGADRLAGPPEPPARIHGDLWSGNVVWGADGRGWLVDPAAHGGHRETDLAMLGLFGAPHLERLLAAYDEEFPLTYGWRERMPLHQLHPLLVHAALFGAGYGARAAQIARSLL